MIFIQRVLGFFLAIVVAVAAFVFASLVLALVAAIALVFGGWFWWRTRNLPRGQGASMVWHGSAEVRRGSAEVRRGPAEVRPNSGEVIEGEYRIEREPRRGGEDPP